MNKRMTAMAIVLALATVASAGWTATGIGSSKEFQVRIGVTGPNDGQFGFIGAVHEDLLGGDEELYSAGVYGLHTVARGAHFPIGRLVPFGALDGLLPETIPCDVYLLGTARLLEEHGGGIDPMVSAGAGLRFEFLIVEYQWTPDAKAWDELPDIEDQHLIYVGGCFATP